MKKTILIADTGQQAKDEMYTLSMHNEVIHEDSVLITSRL